MPLAVEKGTRTILAPAATRLRAFAQTSRVATVRTMSVEDAGAADGHVF